MSLPRHPHPQPPANRRRLVVGWLLLGLLLGAQESRALEPVVRVGVFPGEPLVFLEEGVPRGFCIDLLEAVAASRGWTLRYEPGTWDECLESLRDGSLDLVPTVAYSAARDSFLDFTDEPILTLWSQVFVMPGSPIHGMLDLSDRTVALMRGDINGQNFRDLMARFGLRCSIVEMAGLEEVFAAVAAGEVDAGIAPNIFGHDHADRHGVMGSPIVFSPYDIRFAAPEGRNGRLLTLLDGSLKKWRADHESLYYERLDHWFSWRGRQRTPPSRALLVALAGILAVALLMFIWNRSLKLQVSWRTAELQDREERYRALFDGAGDAIFIIEGGRFTECNAKTLEIFTCTREEIIGQQPDAVSPRFQPVGGESQLLAGRKLALAAAGESPVFPWRHRRFNGEEFDAEVTLTGMSLGGRPVIQAIVRDITERRKLEADLRQAQKLEAIGTLAGGIAHDFNNILAAILGYTELAQMGDLADPELEDNLRQISLAAGRARDLVAQILSFSRKSVEQRQALDLAPIVKEVLQLQHSTLPETIAIRQDIRVRGRVMADPTAIHQVLMNLCTNACQAMAGGGGTLAVSLQEVRRSRPAGERPRSDVPAGSPTAEGDWVVLGMADTGPGMGPEVLEKIFEPYFTTKAAQRGTGLGLAVVHGIVEDHGGWIEVDSRPGEGTEFRVFLPAAAVIEAVPQAPRLPQELSGTETVLLVDDEDRIIDVMRRGLTQLGYTVLAHGSSAAALAAFAADPAAVDIVVTDQNMPGLSGVELAERMLAIRPGLPIVLCTGYSAIVSREEALARGLKEFLTKPVVITELARQIRVVLSLPA